MMGKYNAEKRAYIELLDKAFSPLIDFGGLEYVNVYTTGAEYIKIENTTGGSEFLDVTSHDLEHILLEVMAVAVGQPTDSLIIPKAERREVAKLFRKD